MPEPNTALTHAPLADEIHAIRQVAIIVAHPDDETLWAAGLRLRAPEWQVFVACVCRASDEDRAPRFDKALLALDASGAMADLEDGPEQHPLEPGAVERAIESLLPQHPFDLVLTHGSTGEYTRHRRHEEVCRAVCALIARGALRTSRLWHFAYDDADGRQFPRAKSGADYAFELPPTHWAKKRAIIGKVYGFTRESWEYQASPREEAFEVGSVATLGAVPTEQQCGAVEALAANGNPR